MPISDRVGVHQGDAAPMTGTTLSHYRVLERIGEGATSVVYKAEDLSLGRAVALKLLPPALMADLGKIARFQHEARTTSTLTHPNICTIYEVGQHEDRHFIAMEYLEGLPLSSVIGGRPVDCYRLVELAIQIADGLEAAHAERVVHRDLKPANIYVTYRDHVKLLDFGLSVLMPFGTGSRTPPSATWLAEPGGTVPYMSPEQTLGEQLDTRSDLFSLGVVLYEMATGARPFTGHTNAAIMDAIRQEHPFPARDLNTAVPDELNRIIEKALEKNRKLRYQTASDICADLRRLKRDLDSLNRVIARNATPAELSGDEAAKSRKAPRRRLAILQLIGAAAIGAALGAFGIPWAHRPWPPVMAGATPPAPVPAGSASSTPPPAAPAAALPPPAEAPKAVAAAPAPARSPESPHIDAGSGGTPRDSGAAKAWAEQQLQIAQSKFGLALYDQTIQTLNGLIKSEDGASVAPQAYLLMAAVHKKRGQHEDEIAAYLELAARFPESPRAPEALYAMADAMLQSGKRGNEEQARKIYTDVTTRFPASAWAPRALLSRGALEERQQLRQRDPVLGLSVPTALVTYRELAATYAGSPEREDALWHLGQLYGDIKRFDLAAATLQDLAENYSASSYDAWFTAAEIYDKRLRDTDRARAAYAQVPSTSPKYADAQKRLMRP